MEHPLRYDHYKVLSIPRDASADTIKRAYRERVKNWHPDLNPSPQAATVFQAVHEAYTVLSDAQLRQEYDERLQYYRQANAQKATTPNERSRPAHRADRRHAEEEPDRPVHRFAFYGLHLTGLAFGVSLVMGILIGFTFFGWPGYVLFFMAPGLAVIPDSWEGLRSRSLPCFKKKAPIPGPSLISHSRSSRTDQACVRGGSCRAPGRGDSSSSDH